MHMLKRLSRLDKGAETLSSLVSWLTLAPEIDGLSSSDDEAILADWL